jgi:glutamine synthetase
MTQAVRPPMPPFLQASLDAGRDPLDEPAAQEWLLAHPEALETFASDGNVDLYERYGVFTRSEAVSRAHVMNEKYWRDLNVEAITTCDIARTMILPASLTYQRQLAQTISKVESVIDGVDTEPQRELLQNVSDHIAGLQRTTNALVAIRDELAASSQKPHELAFGYRDNILPAMTAVRAHADCLEEIVADDLWPLPKYREMLFIR